MLILDTHALYWWVNRTPDKLSASQIEAIETADLLAVSAMTCWEMAWLVEHGRIRLRFPVEQWLDEVEGAGVVVMPVTQPIAVLAAHLPEHHKDPADRLIIATAIVHRGHLLSLDARFPSYQELDGLLLS
ncbi:MAG: type II toxin-antitoxin system VapC family toxin [Betaproteobacteria bacterium]|nr:type II toxin-antitoxin system VapC family toxin [Betaproteobacteria bacterium]